MRIPPVRIFSISNNSKKKSGLLLEIFQKYIEDIEKIKNLLSKYLYIIIKLLLEDLYRKDYNNQDF